MIFGKTIELYLVNGTTDGIATAELSNWNGKAIKIHRTDINKCNRDDITLPEVYFLNTFIQYFLFICNLHKK